MNMLMQHMFRRAVERSDGKRLHHQGSRRRRRSSLHGSWKLTASSASIGDFTEDFLHAVGENDLATVESLIYDIDDESTDESIGLHALQIAVKEGHCDMTEFLLTHCAVADDLFNPDVDSHNPLLVTACERGHIDVARLLVSYGANVNATNSMCISPLMAASKANFPELIYFLIDNGAQMDQQTEEEPIPTRIRWLLETQGLDESKLTEIYSYYKQNTALTIAVMNGRIAAVKVLVDKGTQINSVNSYSNTALHIALKPYPIISEALEKLVPGMVKELLERGALVSVLNRAGFNAFDQLLSEIFAIRNSQNSVDCMRNIFDTVILLLRAGGNPYRFSLGEKSSGAQNQNLYSMLNNLYSTGQDLDWEKRARKSYISCTSIIMVTRKQISYDDIALVTKNLAQGKDLSHMTKSLMKIVECGFSLKQLCRRVIRDNIRPPLLVKVSELEKVIPKSMVRYVALTKANVLK